MKLLTITVITLLLSLNLDAQGRGRARGQQPPATIQHNPNATMKSNAPWSADRDKGAQRAQDVGRGKKKGLNKQHKQ